MDEKKEYYGIITEIWKAFRKHIGTVSEITSATDARWKEICNDFDAIEASAVGGYEIICIDGVWKCKKGSYYTHSLRDEEHFPVVGDVKIDILGYVKDKMLAEVKRFNGGIDGKRESNRNFQSANKLLQNR